jgi:hypothetical protein
MVERTLVRESRKLLDRKSVVIEKLMGSRSSAREARVAWASRPALSGIIQSHVERVAELVRADASVAVRGRGDLVVLELARPCAVCWCILRPLERDGGEALLPAIGNAAEDIVPPGRQESKEAGGQEVAA